MTLSSSNNILAFGSEARIKLYNVEKKEDPIDLQELSSPVLTLAFQGNCNNNNTLISCDNNGYIQFWDIISKQNLKVIELYNTMPILLSPNGKFIVYKDHQNYIKLLDLEYPEVVHSFKGSQDKENAIQFSKNENRVAFGPQIWDISGLLNKTSCNINCIEISPYGVHYAIGQKSKIQIFDKKGGIGIDKLKGHTKTVNAIAYSSNALQLVSVGKDKQVIYWNVFYCNIINKHNHHQSNILSVAISKQFIASGDSSGQIIIQRIEPWEQFGNTIANSGQINTLSFSFCNDNNQILFLASSNSDKQIKLWQQNQSTFSEYHTFNGHTDKVRCVTFSYDQKYLASCSNDKSIRFWSVHEKSYLFSLIGHRDEVINIKFTRNNSIWSCSKDNTLKLWDLEQKITIITLDSQNNSKLKSFALSPNDKFLLSLSENDSIQLIDLDGFYHKEEQIKQQKVIKEIALSPDGNIIAYSGDNNLISLCDAKTKQPINHLQLMGVVDQMLFQGMQYLIIVVKKDNKEKNESKEYIIKWDIQKNQNNILGEGSKLAVSFDQKYLAYVNVKTINIIPKSQQQISSTNEIQLLSFSSKGNILASIGGKQIFIWDYVRGEKKQTISFSYVIKFGVFIGNGEWFAYSSGDSAIQFCPYEKLESRDFQMPSQNNYQFKNKDKNVKKVLISNQYIIILIDAQIIVLNPAQKNIIEQPCEQNQILNIAISANGEDLLVLKENFSIEIIKIESFKEYEQQCTANLFCFFSNGEKLLTGQGKKIEIINQKNSIYNQSETLDFDIKLLILSKNENKIAVASQNKILILDSNLKKLQTLIEEKEIKCITFSSGENYIAYICQDKIKLWDCNRNEEDSSIFRDFQKKGLTLIQFFNNIINLLIVTSNELIVFYFETRKENKPFSYINLKIVAIAISNDDQTIAAGCQDGKIRLWNTTDGLFSDLEGSSKSITCLNFESKNEVLASAGEDNIIRIWSIQNKREINQFQTVENLKISCIKYHPITSEIVLSGNGKIYCLLTNQRKGFEHYYLKEDEISNYSISGNGKNLAIQSLSDRNIYIKGTNQSILTIKSIQSYLKLSGQGNKLAYFSSQDQILNVYDLQVGTTKPYQNYKKKIHSIDFSNDEKQMIIGYSDGTIQLIQLLQNEDKFISTKDINHNIKQIIFFDKSIIELNIDHKIYLRKQIAGSEIQKEGQNANAIRIKVLEDKEKLIIKNAGQQFTVLDKNLKYFSPAKSDQIIKSFINIENSQQLWKYRIRFIELNHKCRKFPLMISKLNQDSKFTLQNKIPITITEYFDRQFI